MVYDRITSSIQNDSDQSVKIIGISLLIVGIFLIIFGTGMIWIEGNMELSAIEYDKLSQFHHDGLLSVLMGSIIALCGQFMIILQRTDQI